MDVDRQWLYRRIVEDAGEAVLFADLDGTIRLWNDAAERIFGYSREEAVGSSLDIIVPEEFRDPHWDGYFEAIEAGETNAPDDRLTTVPALRADGDRITIETSGAVVITDDGDPVGVANMIRDVSNR